MVGHRARLAGRHRRLVFGDAAAADGALGRAAALGDRVTGWQWGGIVTGFIGILLVLAPRLVVVDVATLGAVAIPMLVNLISIVAVTLGTFYQKRFVAGADLRTGTCLQFVGALAVVAPLALVGPARFDPTPSLILSLAFSVLVLSIAAIALLLLMIRRGEVAKVAALIYLVPPLTAIEAFVLLGESLNAVQIVGMAVTAVGVWLATRRA